MMNVDIKTLAYMYGVTDMYTQLRIMQEDGKTKFAAFLLIGAIIVGYAEWKGWF